MNRTITHASLFSGIGAPELAAAWLGWKNLFHCETDGFCNTVLNYWYPDSVGYEDITKTDFTQWHGCIDILTGGFPCQPFSAAGQRRGTEDDRYLWPEMLRVIREIQPTWVVGENVAGLLSMVQPGEAVRVGCTASLFDEGDEIYEVRGCYVVNAICEDLEREGYSVQPYVVPACAVGAPHQRNRVWLIARRHVPSSAAYSLHAGDMRGAGLDAGTGPTQRLPERDEIQQSAQPGGLFGTAAPEALAADSEVQRWDAGVHDDGASEGAPKGEGGTEQPGGADCPQSWWWNFPTFSPVCGGNDGLPFDVSRLTLPFDEWRRESIKAFGNAMVPQVVQELFKAIEKEILTR